MKSKIKSVALLFAMHLFFSFGASAQWAAFAQHIYNTNAGNVGVGTFSPLEKLHISGINVATLIGNPTTGYSALRLLGSYVDDYAYIQAGTSSADASAKLRFSRYATTGNNLASFEVYSNSATFTHEAGGYIALGTWDGSVEIGSKNDAQSYIDFKGSQNLGADFTGRILHRDGDGFYINSTGPNTLNVNGKIRAKQVRVETAGVWADYVFAPDYELRPLEEIEAFIRENNHLPDVPSACEVETDGIDVASMLTKQLEKIEELTLYLIELKKENDALQTRVSKLENR